MEGGKEGGRSKGERGKREREKRERDGGREGGRERGLKILFPGLFRAICIYKIDDHLSSN